MSETISRDILETFENPFPDQKFDVVIGQEAWCHIPDKPRLIAECVRVTKVGGRIAFTDILERGGLNAGDREKLSQGMGYVDVATLAEYQDLLAAAGCVVEEVEDLSGRWAVILRQRLEMYRSLEAPTIASFGEAVYRRWDDIYTLFVGLIEGGQLGGGRFLARRHQ